MTPKTEAERIKEFFDNATTEQIIAFLFTHIIPEKTW